MSAASQAAVAPEQSTAQAAPNSEAAQRKSARPAMAASGQYLPADDQGDAQLPL